MPLQVIVIAVKAISIVFYESYYTEVVIFYTEPDNFGYAHKLQQNPL
jgi:hypothetical protein